MKIIAEKINGTRSRVARAIAERDGAYIGRLAGRQAEAGSAWIDLHAGTMPDREPEDLVWLVDTAQGVTETPLCLDSASPAALAAAVERTRRTPMINSISAEPSRLSGILPIVAEHNCPVIALCMDEHGIPSDVPRRLAILRKVIDATRAVGVPDDMVYADPLVMTLATDTNSVNVALEAMRAIGAEFPQVHLTSGLSNVSFGLPQRGVINRTFLTLAMAAGMDSAIADPLDVDLRAAMFATDMLLGRDKHCLRYIRAHRAGLLGTPPAAAA